MTTAAQGFAQQDLALFANLGITAQLLADAGIQRVTDSEARDQFGFQLAATSDLSGVVFPYFSPATGRRVTARLRRDRPELDHEGKPQHKYVLAYGDNRHLYFPPRSEIMLAESSVPVVLVEAEKSALALVALADRRSRPLFPVSCGGCWGWRGRVGKLVAVDGSRVDEKGPLSDLDLIEWKSREAIILFDSNSTSNYKVHVARLRLAQELERRGALVLIAELPALEGVNGPDDALALCGDDAVLALLAAARSCSYRRDGS